MTIPDNAFYFKVDPMGAPRMTRADSWRKPPRVLKYHDFRDEISFQANQQGYEVPERLGLVFIIPMPPSWTKKKRQQMEGAPHQSKPDCDNIQKAFLDALCTDDQFVWDIHATKFWGLEGAIYAWELT